MEYVIPNIRYQTQVGGSACWITCVSMALEHWGISQTQDQLWSRLQHIPGLETIKPGEEGTIPELCWLVGSYLTPQRKGGVLDAKDFNIASVSQILQENGPIFIGLEKHARIIVGVKDDGYYYGDPQPMGTEKGEFVWLERTSFEKKLQTTSGVNICYLRKPA